MCGGIYEEEFEVKGPKWTFESDESVREAAAICVLNVPADSWRVVENRSIVFASVKAEEMYSKAKAATGSVKSKISLATEGQSKRD